MELEKMELDKNEDILLDNLQKEIEKSELRDRSKLVELDEAKVALTMTKEVNRALMDELNSKECILAECRKLYPQLLAAKTGP
jgi:hypothetical protein